MWLRTTLLLVLLLKCCSPVLAQAQSSVPNSFPHACPGSPPATSAQNGRNASIPSPPPSPVPPTQRPRGAHPLTAAAPDFEVTDALPNITGALPRSYAGNIPVGRAGHPNDTLFFWAFERPGANGSLTAPAGANSTEPWIIWLQGG